MVKDATRTTATTATTVIVADSHPLYLLGLTQVIRDDPALTLIASARTGPEALALIQEHRPQVAALDLDLRDLDARDIVRRVRTIDLPTRVLLFSEHHTGELVLQCLTAGATGFLSRHAEPDAVREAIVAVADGRSVLPSDVGPALADTLRQRGESDQQILSEREREILELLAQGESAGEIGIRLHIATPTVKTHVQNLYGKLGVNDRGAAVAVAIRRGLIQ